MENSNNVKVVVRVRPLNDDEQNHGTKKCLAVVNTSSVTIDSKPEPKIFNYDYVVSEEETQESVFTNVAKPIADYWMEGYNGTIFAYGQTGSGKTYTIQGPDYEDIENGIENEETIGIMPRSFVYIFNNIREKEQEDDVEFLVKCSYFEIYNEHIMDLLDPNQGSLLIREDIKKGVYVEGLTEEICSSANDMVDLIRRGVSNRHVGSTSMNERSSRSHSVLTTFIESKTQREGLWNIRMSRFHIIDLAGSERAKSANTAGERLKEAGMINKSLSTLGNVINSLVEVAEGRMRHIHYRDSKLTFLLRDSLGGNSKTLIIANVSPNSNSFGETLSTLKFAQRAKLIKNKAIINEDSAGTVAILKEEIKRLKLLLAKQQTNEPDSGRKIHQLFSSTLEKINSIDEDQESTSYSPEKGMSGSTKKRILELEKLLQKNLDYTSQIQEYNDKDVEEKDQAIKKLQAAVDGFEKQRTRDKMIIKFRDSTIQRFGNLADKVDSEELKKELENKIAEIENLNQQIESNPQTAKLFVENKLLKKEKEELKKIVDNTMDSLSSQYRSAIEFTATLNKYIKEYIEKEEMERDDIIKAQVDIERAELKAAHEEELNRLEEIIYQSNANLERLAKDLHELDQEKHDAMNTILELKQEIESIKEKSTEELELAEKRFAESLDQVKTEVKEGKESEIQEFKIKLIEAEQSSEELNKTINKLNEQKEKSDEWIEEMRRSLEALEKEKIDFLQQIDSFQEQLLSKDSEIEALKEVEKIKESLETENTTLKNDLKKLEKNYTKTSESLNVVQEELSELKDKYNALEEENDTNQKEYDYKISKLEEELSSMTTEKEDIEAQLKSLNEAEEFLKLELKKQSSKSEEVLSGLEQERETSKTIIMELQQKLEVEQKKATKLEKQTHELEKQTNELEKQKEQIQIEYEMKTSAFDTQKEDFEKSSHELKELQERHNALMDEHNNCEEEQAKLQEKINDLEVKLEWLTVSEADKKKLIKSLEKEVESLKESSKKKEAELEKLKQNKSERDAILKETQETIKGSKESIKLLKDEKDKCIVEIEKLRRELNSAEEKVQELEMERQIKEEQEKETKEVMQKRQEEQEREFKENMQKHQEEQEREFKENMQKRQEDPESSKQSLEAKDVNTPTNTLSAEDAKMLLYQIKKREKEQRRKEEALREEIEDLKFQLDKMQTISDFQGHNNPGQKIKHLLKIKEENNQLKKELCKLFTENRKIKEAEEKKDDKSK